MISERERRFMHPYSYLLSFLLFSASIVVMVAGIYLSWKGFHWSDKVSDWPTLNLIGLIFLGFGSYLCFLFQFLLPYKPFSYNTFFGSYLYSGWLFAPGFCILQNKLWLAVLFGMLSIISIYANIFIADSKFNRTCQKCG